MTDILKPTTEQENVVNLVEVRQRRHPQRTGAMRPLGHLIGGDLQFRCIRCNRAMRPTDITVNDINIVIDCTCGERSEIWTPIEENVDVED
jgi:hypothetical protein